MTQKSSSQPPRKPGPPAWAIAAIVALFWGLVLGANVISWFGDGSLPPFMKTDGFAIAMIFLPMVILVAVMVAAKLIDTRRAGSWPSAMGRVVRSEMRSERRKSAGEATRVINVPDVEYEFATPSGTFRGRAIQLGAQAEGPGSEASLARYPVGAVVEVFYNPRDPSECALERDIPEGAGRGCAIGLAVLAVLGISGYYAGTTGVRLIDARGGQGAPAMFALFFAFALLLFFIAARRNAGKVAGWPTVEGTVEVSGVEALRDIDRSTATWRYTPAVEYTYRVGANVYRSRVLRHGVTIATTRAGAEQVAARYRVGATVAVHYDPANPADAALMLPGRLLWIIPVVALLVFALAAYLGGFLRGLSLA